MAARFSRISAAGLLLATTIAFEGCTPLHLAWERQRTFGTEPARVVDVQNSIVVRWLDSSDAHATFVAQVRAASTYERETSENLRRLTIRGESWTIDGVLIGLVALCSVPSGEGDYGSAFLALLGVVGGIVGITLAVDVVSFLLSVPPAIRAGIFESGADGPRRPQTYVIESFYPCESLTLTDPATGASLDLVTIQATGAVIDAATLRAVGFRSAEVVATSGDLRARVALPPDFARSLSGR
ncbi:MAG: hypothetical protein HYY18_11230 [Planctomycetes bacterium]|nr:hypothetical protein [Planctomycetota bacterium]